jgi:predicted O-methyltransferase YrrM
MTAHDLWAQVDAYIADLYVAPDQSLEDALSSSAEHGLPSISVSPPQGKLLHLLARLQGARTILEIGTLGGYSTIWLARALPPGGRLITLEKDAKHAEIARSNITGAALEGVVEVRVGPAQETLPALERDGPAPFDLVFIDADKRSYPEYLTWSLRLTRNGSLIIADNVVRDGAVLDDSSTDPDVRGVRRFNEMLGAEPRISATAIQTVGGKGYDGFTLALVTGEQRR